MLPAVLLALWSTSAASGAEFTVRVLSTHDVRGTVAARVCQQPCGLGGCGGASKRQAAIASGRMNAADNTTGMLTDLVVIDGGTARILHVCGSVNPSGFALQQIYKNLQLDEIALLEPLWKETG